VLETLADLLADPAPVARTWAARALLEQGGTEAAALIRLRLHIGEEAPSVLLDCLTTLLVLTGDRGIEFTLSGYLTSPRDPFWPVGVLALGESKLEAAVCVLINLYREAVRPETRRQILEAIALNRNPGGLDFLLEVVKEGSSGDREAGSELVRQFWGDKRSLERLRAALDS
jgi:HEAT repeat protein